MDGADSLRLRAEEEWRQQSTQMVGQPSRAEPARSVSEKRREAPLA